MLNGNVFPRFKMWKIKPIILVLLLTLNLKCQRNVYSNFIVSAQEYITPRKWHQQQHQRKSLSLFRPPKSLLTTYIWGNHGNNNDVSPQSSTKMVPRSTKQIGKRFLSSESKQSMRDVSLASNSNIHDNYISQQFKWSNSRFSFSIIFCFS